MIRVPDLADFFIPSSKVSTGPIMVLTRLVMGLGFLERGYAKVINGPGHFAVDGIMFGPPGYEVILLYLVSLLALFRLGVGRLSVDSLLRKRFTVKKV